MQMKQKKMVQQKLAIFNEDRKQKLTQIYEQTQHFLEDNVNTTNAYNQYKK